MSFIVFYFHFVKLDLILCCQENAGEIVVCRLMRYVFLFEIFLSTKVLIQNSRIALRRSGGMVSGLRRSQFFLKNLGNGLTAPQ